MPISISQPINILSEQEFHDLDYQIMKLAFETHNGLGRFYNEKIYQNKLIELCQKNEITVDSEVQIEIQSGTSTLGTQNIPLLSHEESFCMSSVRNGISTYQTHLQRFLRHTDLKHLHWINMNSHNIEFKTLSN